MALLLVYFNRFMSIQILEIPPARLEEYTSISIGFWVRSKYEVRLLEGGLGGMQLVEAPVEPAFFKDYDATEVEGSPVFWPKQFDVSQWGFLLAFDGDQAVGAAAIAFHSAGVNMLESRADLAVLWDMRVQPWARGKGVGAELLAYACDWAHRRGARQMKIETQNINMPACRFYAHQGCELGLIHRFAYAAIANCTDEVMMCWYRNLE